MTAGGITMRAAVTGASATQLVFVVYNAAGATLNSAAISFVYEAEGSGA